MSPIRIATFSLKAAVTASAFVLAAAGVSAAQDDLGTSFVEQFDRLDQSRWYISDGWTNGPHQNCFWNKSNVEVKDGILKLSYSRGENSVYQCGEIQTQKFYSHGLYEIRMKAPPRNSGFNAAFFSYVGPPHGKPHDEIDFEILLRPPGSLWLNVHVNGEGNNGTTIEDLPLSEEFIDYAFDWKPDSLSWYVNGKLVRQVTDAKLLPTNAQKIFASLWSTDTLVEWMGKFEEPQFPFSLEIDRIAYTAPGDQCQFPESVACKR